MVVKIYMVGKKVKAYHEGMEKHVTGTVVKKGEFEGSYEVKLDFFTFGLTTLFNQNQLTVIQ